MASHGGARPGAGRKRKETVDAQKVRRTLLLEVFNEAEFRACCVTWLSQIKAGNIALLFPLLPYLMGSPKQEVVVTIKERARQMAEADGLDADELIRVAEELVGVG